MSGAPEFTTEWYSADGHLTGRRAYLTGIEAVNLAEAIVRQQRRSGAITRILIYDGLDKIVYEWTADAGRILPEVLK
jgi:hypothetical protein